MPASPRSETPPTVTSFALSVAVSGSNDARIGSALIEEDYEFARLASKVVVKRRRVGLVQCPRGSENCAVDFGAAFERANFDWRSTESGRSFSFPIRTLATMRLLRRRGAFASQILALYNPGVKRRFYFNVERCVFGAGASRQGLRCENLPVRAIVNVSKEFRTSFRTARAQVPSISILRRFLVSFSHLIRGRSHIMKSLAGSARIALFIVTVAILPTLMMVGAPTTAGAATITAVQSGDVGTAALASGAAGTVLPANATLGDTIVLAVLGSGSTGQVVASVTSPMGTFVKVNASLQTGQSDIELWVLSGVTSAGRTVTVTMSGGSTWYAQATEFSGTLSAVANAPTTGASTGPSGSVTTSANDVAVLYVNGLSSSLSSGPASPWVNYNAGAFKLAWDESVSYQVVGASGTVTGTWKQSSSAKWQVIGLYLAPSA